MAGILIASHGMLAKELCGSVNFFLGEDDSLDHSCLDEKVGIDQYKKDLYKKIESMLQKYRQLLIVCDLYFGSPYIAAVEYVCSCQLDQQIKVVSGANLPMLLELCAANQHNTERLDLLAEKALQFGRNGIMQYVRKESASEEELSL